MDEWGRVWRDGLYVTGVVDSPADLARYNPPTSYAAQFLDERQAGRSEHASRNTASSTARTSARSWPRTWRWGWNASASGPWPILPSSTPCWPRARSGAWRSSPRASALGAEVIVMGDDAAHGGGPLISPRMWRKFVLPCHRRIATELPVPVIWHSDGDTARLLPMAVEAGFAGIHGLEPWSMSLAETKAAYAGKLVLLGNADVRTCATPTSKQCGERSAAAPRRAGRADSCSRPATASSPA